MQLFIKLPKGKTGKAYERAAEHCSERIGVLNKGYRVDLEDWRKAKDRGNVPCAMNPPERPVDIMRLTVVRDGYWSASDACQHSTGDVYLGHDEWEKIKGYYI